MELIQVSFGSLRTDFLAASFSATPLPGTAISCEIRNALGAFCYPEKFISLAYRVGINYIIYAMTH